MSEPSIAPRSDAPRSANDQDVVFAALRDYDFVSDTEFRIGLGTILGHRGQPASEEECKSDEHGVIAAKAFYYSKKFDLVPPIQYKLYIDWLERNNLIEREQPNGEAPKSEGTDAGPSASQTTTAEGPSTEDATPYPSSFARIVELITTGQPIPGIQQIPDTVLVGQGSQSVIPPRRKPWEKEDPINANKEEEAKEHEGPINASNKDEEAKKEHEDTQATA